MDVDEESDIDTWLFNNFELVCSLLTTDDCSFETQLRMRYAMLKLQLFWRHGRMEDLLHAVEQGKIAVAKTSEQHEAFTGRLNSLGVILGSLYERTGKIENLEETIRVVRQTIKTTPEDYSNLAGRLNNLENKLESRYKHIGRLKDLEEIIRVARQAIKITFEDYLNLEVYLHNLEHKLGCRYDRTKQIENFEETIRVVRQAIKTTVTSLRQYIAYAQYVAPGTDGDICSYSSARECYAAI